MSVLRCLMLATLLLMLIASCATGSTSLPLPPPTRFVTICQAVTPMSREEQTDLSEALASSDQRLDGRHAKALRGAVADHMKMRAEARACAAASPKNED